jgi:hypothetical protein
VPTRPFDVSVRREERCVAPRRRAALCAKAAARDLRSDFMGERGRYVGAVSGNAGTIR